MLCPPLFWLLWYVPEGEWSVTGCRWNPGEENLVSSLCIQLYFQYVFELEYDGVGQKC